MTEADNPDTGNVAPFVQRIKRRASKATTIVPTGEEIVLEDGKLHETVERAERALVGRGIYQRGGALVFIGARGGKGRPWLRRDEAVPTINLATPHLLATEMTRAARWLKWDGRSEGYKPADAPLGVAKALLERVNLWELPVLTGLVFSPTLQPDGTLLEAEGYDPATGLFAAFLGTEFSAVPEAPTKEEARTALEMLTDLVREFPFEAETDRATAVAAMLTAVIRPALRTAPLFGFTAPKPRSGKSLLATLPALLATGHRPTVVSFNSDPAEEKKRLLSLLLAGDPVISIDNLSRPLGGDALCSILTEESYSDRLLGASRSVRVPSAATFLATGNNLTVMGDMTARTILCRIDPAVERPEERLFEIDLKAEVPRRRGELVPAALTVVRAYLGAGMPETGAPTWGGFEDWCRWVRDPLVWLGMADPGESRRGLEDADPIRRDLVGLLEAWHEAFGERGTTVAEACHYAAGGPLAAEAPERLREALDAVAGEKDGINRRKLGRFLLRYAGRIERGLKFAPGATARDRTEWHALKVAR